MVRYRRNFVPGGCYFFTLTLADRRSSALVHEIAALRAAFRRARRQRPFSIEAIVVLPDHLHAIWTLPPEDADYSGRWRLIKTLFSNHVIAARGDTRRHRNGELALWQRRYWEHTIRSDDDFSRRVDTFISIPSNTPLYRAFKIGGIRLFIAMSSKDCCRTTG